MKCVIGGARVRVFGRALHAIARISDEFWIDPKEKGLFLRTVNNSRSAYACVFFSSMFFQNYSYKNATELSLNGNTVQLACKLIIKAILPLFRCLHTLERNVEKCNIYTDFNNCHIVFKLFCKHGVVKTHSLAFQEYEPLQAVFAKHLCTNVLKVQSRQLSDMLIHFPTYQDEITLAVTPVKVCFKTYTEDEMEFTKATHIEIHLSPEEFEYFQVGVDSEVTFCLKELRGLLMFAEAINAPVSIHFDVSGKPVAFSIEDMAIEAMLVLATLSDTESWTTACKPTCLAQGQNRSPALERSNPDIVNCSRSASPVPSEGFSAGEGQLPPGPSYNQLSQAAFQELPMEEGEKHQVASVQRFSTSAALRWVDFNSQNSPAGMEFWELKSSHLNMAEVEKRCLHEIGPVVLLPEQLMKWLKIVGKGRVAENCGMALRYLKIIPRDSAPSFFILPWYCYV